MDTLANLTRPESPKTGGVRGGTNGESGHSGALEPKLLKVGSKSCQAKEC